MMNPPSSTWWRSTPSCPSSSLSPAPTGPNYDDEDDHNDEHDDDHGHDNDPDPLQLVLFKAIISIIIT